MNIEITLTAPDWMSNYVVDAGRCNHINERLAWEEEQVGLDYEIFCQPSRENWLAMNKIEFVVDNIDRLAVPAMMELVHGLIFEEFDVEFE